MFRNKKLLLAVLMLAIASLLVAQDGFTHPEEECHFWFGLNFSHTIEEGETLCFYSNFLQATPGLLNNLIQGADIGISIYDAAGNPVVADARGAWGPIQKVDSSLFGLEDCPMPTIAIARWEYSPETLELEAGSYVVWFNTVVERPIVDGFHMCAEPPSGPPNFTLPEDSFSFPVSLTVEPTD